MRLRQAYTAPDQYRSIYHSKVESGSASRTQYIRCVAVRSGSGKAADDTTPGSFYNMLWLIANDAIIGSAVTAFCLENNELIAQYIAAALKVNSPLPCESLILELRYIIALVGP